MRKMLMSLADGEMEHFLFHHILMKKPVVIIKKRETKLEPPVVVAPVVVAPPKVASATRLKYNGGNWTKARFREFITSNLRKTSGKWGPKLECQREARVDRGFYLCKCCNEKVPWTKREGGKRVQNVFVDHIDPVIDPSTGFTTWDSFIDRLFCEKENLQILCKDCHDSKTSEERLLRKMGRIKS
jgi:hypothetical protein